jgi:lipoprotein signal peptidase
MRPALLSSSAIDGIAANYSMSTGAIVAWVLIGSGVICLIIGYFVRSRKTAWNLLGVALLVTGAGGGAIYQQLFGVVP